jgi:tellurite resistance protein TerC
MIAGVSWVWWLGFHAVVAALLVADALLTRGLAETRRTQARAWLWTALLVAAATGFAAWIAIAKGHQPALEFVAGYAIESSLSVDNLFVFLVLFQGFRITPGRQHTALLWGVAGAVVLRALFIAAGITLLRRFEWITWIFGLILLYAAWRLIRGGSANAAIPAWIQRLQPARGLLLPVILAVEVTDVLFAFDSIPAVLAVSHNPFVVYTSNIAAILGLRSLYFALAELL